MLILWVFVSQSRSATGETSAFHVSEAGVHYVLHLLNSGACLPEELIQQQPIMHDVPGLVEDDSLGLFSVALNPLPSEGGRWQLQSIGRAAGGSGCQSVEAQIEMFSGVLGTKYRVVSWEQHEEERCWTLVSPSVLSCQGVSAK